MASAWDIQAVSASNQGFEAQGVPPGDAPAGNEEMKTTKVQDKFRAFLRTFREDETFVYREQLLANYQQGTFTIVVDLQHLESFDEALIDLIQKYPSKYMPVFESAAKEVVVLSLVPRPEPKNVENIQIQLTNYNRFTDIRRLAASDVAKLVCVRGIVVSAGRVRVKATTLKLACRNCKSTKDVQCGAGFGGARIPRMCDTQPLEGEEKCPLDPFRILPDSSTYQDIQRLKLQENPEEVPTGEMPRHVSLSLSQYLVNHAKPGTRVTVVGVFSIFQSRDKAKDRANRAVALRYPYVRVLGITNDGENLSQRMGRFDAKDEEEMVEMARQGNIYKCVANSMAPAIFGMDDVKKAIACQLFGGARKELPDGMRLRGDINILLLGDPSTAKSQFLKFAVEVAPVGVYTSGKGSSAAGLTASVLRDPSTGEFQLEGGALVLADGGLVCIDEFDKMREQDRVAIHEAMEQQTISIAKAGITTILNSRTSVLAAANPAFGRYDDMRSPTENIDFQSTILSRFDLLFIVRDIRNEERDSRLAKHIVNIHRHGDEAEPVEGEIDNDKLKRYIAYARANCNPRLSQEAARMLMNQYVTIRTKAEQGKRAHRGRVIPITVRQLEAIIRISEALARIELEDVANVEHVKEAIRLFKVSTFQAVTSTYGSSSGAQGPEHIQRMINAEKHLRARIAIGSRVSTKEAIGDLVRAGHEEPAVRQAVDVMVKRNELQYQAQQRMLFRHH